MEQVEYRVLSLDIPAGSFVRLRTKLFTDSKSQQWIWKLVAFKLLDTATNALFRLKICIGYCMLCSGYHKKKKKKKSLNTKRYLWKVKVVGFLMTCNRSGRKLYNETLWEYQKLLNIGCHWKISLVFCNMDIWFCRSLWAWMRMRMKMIR